MGQKFYADPKLPTKFFNNAIGYSASASPSDCLGPFAKVSNCPIHGTELRLTAYATGYADTAFSIPACTRYRGQYIGGYFAMYEGNVTFRPMDRFMALLAISRKTGRLYGKQVPK